jgi:hypothetical protein
MRFLIIVYENGRRLATHSSLMDALVASFDGELP